MNLELNNRVAMIAASSKGLGKASALAVAAEGCHVSICARNAAELEKTAAEIQAYAGESVNVLATEVDISSLEDLTHWHQQTVRQLGQVDILVTNTGGPPVARFMNLTDEQWRMGINSTLMNVVRLTRMVVPQMQQKKWGRIIHLTSFVAKQPADDLTISSTLRAGISALTRTMSSQFGPDNITVNALLMGHILTDRQYHIAASRISERGISEKEYFDEVAAQIPLRRLGQPHELGDAVAFLASERAAYISGVSLLVDGGLARGTM
jgi:3-oxoacyl-[acyl-carrier protein] reductase